MCQCESQELRVRVEVGCGDYLIIITDLVLALLVESRFGAQLGDRMCFKVNLEHIELHGHENKFARFSFFTRHEKVLSWW